MKLRIATIDDRKELLDMAQELYKASPYNRGSLDINQVWHNLGVWIEDKQSKVAVVATSDSNHPLGFILGFVVPSVFNSDLIAYELAWWTKPEYTRNGVAFSLLEAYEAWAKKVGATYVAVNRFGQHPLGEKIDSRLKERGYKIAEYSFMKEVT